MPSVQYITNFSKSFFFGGGSGKNEVANVLRLAWKFAKMRKINESLGVFFFFSVNVDFHV